MYSIDLKGKRVRVRDVLLEKHPEPQEPGAAAMPQYAKLPEMPTLDITAETIEKVAKELKGSAGPSGVHSLWWRPGALAGARGREERAAIREAVDALARRLANDVVPWEDVRALVAMQQLGSSRSTRLIVPRSASDWSGRVLAACMSSGRR